MADDKPVDLAATRFTIGVYTPPQDFGPCLDAGTHLAAQRHTRVDCPAVPEEGLYRARHVDRSQMIYGVLYPMAEVGQEEPTYCSKNACPNDPRSDLYAILYPNPRSKDGNLKFYCPEHAYGQGSTRATSSSPRTSPRQTGEACPSCGMIFPATGLCDYC